MGLFNFWKDKGEKVIEANQSAAEDIRTHILSNNPGVTELRVGYEDGVVKLGGTAESAEAKEKAVLLAGNVQGVEEVEANNLKAPPPGAEVKVEYYEIQSGDTLSKLAKTYYGDPMQYPRIFEANKEVIRDADLIYPGQKIRIPL